MENGKTYEDANDSKSKRKKQDKLVSVDRMQKMKVSVKTEQLKANAKKARYHSMLNTLLWIN